MSSAPAIRPPELVAEIGLPGGREVLRVTRLHAPDGAELIDLSVFGPTLDGTGLAPLVGRGIALPAARWTAIIPTLAAAVLATPPEGAP